MPRPRPEFSITLPKDFTFHYNEGEAPQTPDQTTSANSNPGFAQPLRPYRLKRPSRRPLASIFSNDFATIDSVTGDGPLPSIGRTVESASRPAPLTNRASTLSRLPPSWRSPRTPEPCGRPLISAWNSLEDAGDSIIRPLSSCSLFSDSSDASDLSLASDPPGDGSCTSVESEAFSNRLPIGRKEPSSPRVSLPDPCRDPIAGLRLLVKWTAELDRHLWATYLRYLQDPTVTPFKMLPGVAPPLGICHRVAKEARKSWRGPVIDKIDMLLPSHHESSTQREQDGDRSSARDDSPDTLREPRSGSTTPTKASRSRQNSIWPKSASATRRRLRHLCKQKPAMAPHYQRIFQNRSPSPFTQSSRSSSCPDPTLPVKSTKMRTSFNNRDLQISLTTCTADSMQPDGPLARLAEDDELLHGRLAQNFNDLPMPFASEIPVPSELNRGSDEVNSMHDLAQPVTPRLGSPFGYHTWGPSQYRRVRRATAERTPVSGLATIGFSARSQVHHHDSSNSLTNIDKLEERRFNGREVGGAADVFADACDFTPNLYRDKSRMTPLSVGNSKQHPLESLFDAPNADPPRARTPSTPIISSSSVADPLDSYTPTPALTGQLKSPFHERLQRIRGSPLSTTDSFSRSPWSPIQDEG